MRELERGLLPQPQGSWEGCCSYSCSLPCYSPKQRALLRTEVDHLRGMAIRESCVCCGERINAADTNFGRISVGQASLVSLLGEFLGSGQRRCPNRRFKKVWTMRHSEKQPIEGAHPDSNPPEQHRGGMAACSDRVIVAVVDGHSGGRFFGGFFFLFLLRRPVTPVVSSIR